MCVSFRGGCLAQAYVSIVAHVAKYVNSFLVFFYDRQKYVGNYRGENADCFYVFIVKIILTKAVLFDIMEV